MQFNYPQILLRSVQSALPVTTNHYGPITGNLLGAMNISVIGPDGGLSAEVIQVNNNAVASPQLSLNCAAYQYAWNLDTNELHINHMRGIQFLEAGISTATAEKAANCVAHMVVEDFAANIYYATAMLHSDDDDQEADQNGLQGVVNRNTLFNDDSWDLARCTGNNFDAMPTHAIGVALGVSTPMLWNGATLDRARAGSAANLSAAQQSQGQMVTQLADWGVTHTPAANNKATITRASGGAGVRHVATSITFSLFDTSGAAAAGPLTVALRDGTTGAGTILWSITTGFAAGFGGTPITLSLSGLNLIGSAATAMTLEFSAAGGATVVESVSLTGHDVA